MELYEGGYASVASFYEDDDRRRWSSERCYGREWRDAHGRLWNLYWVEETGELYWMAKPKQGIGGGSVRGVRSQGLLSRVRL